MAKALYERSDASDPSREEYLEEYEYFLSESLDYANSFDPAIGFFQDKTTAGQWALTPREFDPRQWYGPYTEEDAWNYAFTVPQDGQGGPTFTAVGALAAKLDQLFDPPETTLAQFNVESSQASEAMDAPFGQWGINNEPSFHIPYMYDYVGEPYKAQAIVRAAEARLFVGSEIGQGYLGDDDSGAMSSWQVFSALGFYPLQVGSPYYVIGSPLYKQATVHLENGKEIVINAPNNSPTNVYIQGLTLDGKPYDKTYLSQAQLAQGAVLDFDMGPAPSKWGTASSDAPLSITQGNAAPDPMHDATGPGLGIATASQNTNVAGLFDNTSDTQVTFNPDTVGAISACRGGQKITFYTLTSGATAGGDPSSWALQGSNDGLHWTTLDQRQGQTFPWRLQTRPFKVANPGSYSDYSLEVT